MNARIAILVATVYATVVLATTAPASAVTLYSVRPKDTLAKIAQKSGVSADRLLVANPELRNHAELKIGQIIVIPEADEFTNRDEEEDAPPAAARTSAAALASLGSVAPAPLPTPAQDAGPEVDTIGFINDQSIRVDPHHRFELSSRRGLLLNQITALARTFMGVPYVWGGTTPRGYDCSGFTMRMYKLAGIQIKRLADEQFYQGTPTNDPLPGDLVFFHTYLPGPSHCGIYLGNNLFIHASSRKGVTISSLNDPYFKKRFLGARRFF